ncbi:MAG: hypothetical protein AUK47_15940 [Deltaproteobacteria bacterium CG2_30_63_29]|nr:MAG: hypothetical protein AUK47_15940 [Deltaproteobacteria bacterium CG2_30_63_29]
MTTSLPMNVRRFVGLFMISLFCSWAVLSCSLGLDFEGLEACPAGQIASGSGDCACPAGSTMEGRQCLCADDRGPLGADGTCACEVGKVFAEGACQCPAGTTFSEGSCLCADGRVYLPLEGGDVCGACPRSSTANAAYFSVPGEGVWCSGLLSHELTLGNPQQSVSEVSLIEDGEDLVVAFIEVDGASQFVLKFVRVSPTADGKLVIVSSPIETTPANLPTATVRLELVSVDGMIWALIFDEQGGVISINSTTGLPTQITWAADDPWKTFQPWVTARFARPDGDRVVAIGAAPKSADPDDLALAQGTIEFTVVVQATGISVLAADSSVEWLLASDPDRNSLSPWEFNPISGGDGTFIASGFATNVVLDGGGAYRLENSIPLLLELTYPADASAVISRQASLGAIAEPMAVWKQAIVDLVNEGRGTQFLADDIGFAAISSTAQAKEVSSILAPFLTRCEADVCQAGDAEIIEVLFDFPVFLSRWRRDSSEFSGTSLIQLDLLAPDVTAIAPQSVGAPADSRVFVMTTIAAEGQTLSVILADSLDQVSTLVSLPIQLSEATSNTLHVAPPYVVVPSDVGVELYLLSQREL